MAKRIVAPVYTHGKFGKGWREIVDTDNPFLYSMGRYPTKLTKEDMPEDYIYISYKEKLVKKTDEYGFTDYVNYDVCVCGNDIIEIVLAAEKYSGFDTTEVRNKIEEKRVWLRDNEPDFYSSFVGEDEDIFSLWTRKGYITPRLLNKGSVQ